MKNFLAAIFLLIGINCWAQNKAREELSSKTLQIPKVSLQDSLIQSLHNQQNDLRSNIDSIKTTLKIVETNTEPPNAFSEFLKGKVMDEIYDWMFSKEQSGGLITFSISCLGLLASFIKFIIAVIDAYKWIDEKNSDKKWAIPSAFTAMIFFVVSGLLFVAANRSYESGDAAKIANLDSKITSLMDEIRRVDVPANTKHKSDTVRIISEPSQKYDSISVQLSSIRMMIDSSHTNTVETIEKYSTSSKTIFFGFLLIIFIAVGVAMIVFYIISK